MPPEIELSIMETSSEGIQPLLDPFEAETGIRVRVRLMNWDTAWNELVRSALYKDGPDISEIGSTWTGDLIGMNALRPFEAHEVAGFGRSDAFIPAAWQAATAGNSTPWTIPWMCGSRMIFYRKAWLDRAGLDPETAFHSPAAFDDSLSRLSASGAELPWLVPLAGSHENLHNLASWVWAEGGDFLQPGEKAVTLLEPAGLRALEAYFALSRFFPARVRGMTSTLAQDLFVTQPGAAATISGPWFLGQLRQELGPDFGSQIGAAMPPGPSFVGGSNLLVWKYSRQPDAAVRLARFLTAQPAQISYCQQVGLLPARAAVLQMPPYANDRFWQVSARSLLNGRSFPSIPLWGLVEERLGAGVNQVWSALFSSPEMDLQSDLRPLLVRVFDPIRKRLDLLLEGR